MPHLFDLEPIFDRISAEGITRHAAQTVDFTLHRRQRPARPLMSVGSRCTVVHKQTVEDVLMKMRGLNHINLIVSDVQRSAEFYETLFGMQRQHEVGDFVFLSCGDSDLGLVGGTPHIHRRFHFGFRLDSRDEVDAWLLKVKTHGSHITHGPVDYGDYFTFTCRDPDGYGIEIYHEPGPRGRRGFPSAGE